MSLFSPNTNFYTSYFDKERYLLGYRISLIFTFTFGVLSVLSYFYFKEIFLYQFLTFLGGFFCFIYILTIKNYNVLFWFYAFLGTFIISFSLHTSEQITHFVDYIWILVAVLTAFIGISLKVGFLFLVINTLSLLSFIIFSMNTHIKAVKLRDGIDITSEIIETLIALFVFGYLLYKFIQFQTYSEKEIIKNNEELKQKNEYISAQNQENIALVKEVHHRVKNNLQIIISLLRLQSYEIKSKEGKMALTEAINRIMVMSLIHQKLYGNESISNVNLKEYLTELIGDIKTIFAQNKQIKLNIDSNYNVGLKTIVPLGLLFNELASNSFKHAFKNKTEGEISITIKSKVGRDFEVHYFDNGQWIEPDESHFSFGMELLDIMSDQLEGHYERIINDKGTSFIFFLKDIDEEDKRPLKEQLNISETDN